MGELSVLYVCTHNAGRSQMAALLTESLSKGRARANSAGSAPSDVVNPVAVQAMKEIGIDMSEAVPKPLTDQMVVDADVVVTMGCGDACPVIIHKMYRDWSVNDPAGQGIDTVRQVRDSVRSYVESLLLGSVVNCIFPSLHISVIAYFRHSRGGGNPESAPKVWYSVPNLSGSRLSPE